MLRALGLLAAVICLTLGLVLPARAQAPIALSVGATLTLDDLKITVAACTVNNGGSRGSSCPSTGGDLYLAPTSGPGASVIIEALNTSDVQVPIFSYSCPATGTCNTSGTYDLSVTLDVQALGSNTTVTSVAQTLVGSATPSSLATADPGDVHITETVAATGHPDLCSLSSNLSSLHAACPTFAAQTSLSVAKDLGLTLNGISNGSTLTLMSVTQSFTPAPEPASLATLLGGIVALGAMRRKRRRT